MPAGSCAEHVMAQLPEDSIRHFSSFDEFYPFYLEERADRSSRRLHFVGTSLALLLFVYALATRRWALLILVPVSATASRGSATPSSRRTARRRSGTRST